MEGRLTLMHYAVLRHPSEEEAKKGRKTELVVPPTAWKLYSGEQALLMEAYRAIPADKIDDADRFEVAVATF